MDIAAIAKTAAKIGMQIAGTAKKPCVVVLGAAGSAQAYNAATDAITPDPAAVTVNLLALKYAKKVQKNVGMRIIDDTIGAYSHTYAIEAADLPAGAELNEQTKITEGGTTWVTIKVEIDPGQALWLVDVRR